MVNIAETALEHFAITTSPGAFLVDSFPILRHLPSWMPGAGYKKKLPQWIVDFERMADVPHEFVKDRMVCPLSVCLNYSS